MAALLTSAEKRILDLVADWPWMHRDHLADLLDVSGPRASHLAIRLEGLGLLTRISIEGLLRHALSDRGLALLARRDRTSV